MSVRYSLLLLVSLFMVLSSFLLPAAKAEAARIKVKKAAGHKRRKIEAVKRTALPASVSRCHRPGPSLQVNEQYLQTEFGIEDNSVLRKAVELLGIRYRFGGSGYSGIDCSAFVKKVYSLLNQDLPRTAREQFAVGKEVPPEELEKGDLLFFHTYAGFPSHVGIYVGDNLMIHASSGGGSVIISRMDTPYFRSRFIGARRIQNDGGFLSELTGDGKTAFPADTPQS